MEASRMLDVIHYYFDEDMRYGSTEGAQLHSSVREQLFGSMYGYDYLYGLGQNRVRDTKGEEGLEIKPYMPATEFNPDSANPFGGVLDVPIG
jgi:hypothetical protein